MKKLSHFWSEATKHLFVDTEIFPPMVEVCGTNVSHVETDGPKVSYLKIGVPLNAMRLGENPDSTDAARSQTEVLADSVCLHSFLLRYKGNLHHYLVKNPDFGSSFVFSHVENREPLFLDLITKVASGFDPVSFHVSFNGSINLQTGSLIVNALKPVVLSEDGQEVVDGDAEVLGYTLSAHTYNPNTENPNAPPPLKKKRAVHGMVD